MTGEVLVPVLITFLVVNVILIMRAVARGQRGRQGASMAGWPSGTQVALGMGQGPAEQTIASGAGAASGLPADGVPADPAEPQVAAGVPADPAEPQVAAELAADPAEPQVAAGAAAGPAAPDQPKVLPAPAQAGRDTLTGLEDEATWDRRVADESARVRRYRRPVTIVGIELDGLDHLAGLLGDEAADRLVRAMADTLRQHARDTDHIARLGRARFGVIMPETPAEAAVSYVARVTRACERRLESGAVAVRPVIGWASTSGDVGLAEIERLAIEWRQGGPWRDTGRAGAISTPSPAASDAGRSAAAAVLPAADVLPVADVMPAAAVLPAEAPRLDGGRCRVPGCDHKRDHRRVRSP